MTDTITAVTGASGHVGANLVRALLAEGRHVRVLVREDTRALNGLNVEAIHGDIFDPEALTRLLDGASSLFHFAGRISVVGPEHGLVEKTNVEGVKKVLAACRVARVKRLIHCSSIHAFRSFPEDQCIDETRELALDPSGMAYDRSKALGQLAVREAAENGLDAVIVNPTAVLGPNDFKPSRMGHVLLDIAGRRLPALVEGGYNWVDARDVALGAIAAEKKGRKGECYLLSGTWMHITQLAEIVSRVTGMKTAKWPTPVWLALPASYLSLGWGRVVGKTAKFTPSAIRTLQGHRLISHEKATRELGYDPRPIEETVRDTLEWFRQEGGLGSP